MSRPLGRLYRTGDTWTLEGEPHLLLRVKRIFAKANTYARGAVSLQSSDEVGRDLAWLLQRYPITISDADREDLHRLSSAHHDRILRMEDIISRRRETPSFELAVPAREYQKTAATLMLEQKYLLLADDLGLGKTATAICTLTRPETLPAVVVTLSGTMPQQWKSELKKFAPNLDVHVLRKATPYALPSFMGNTPDVLVLNYHKLSGWSQTLGNYARTVIFDEIQELRRSESNKYKAALHIARNATYRYGLSATPIYNYGGEIWNVVHVLGEDILGSHSEFLREWCSTTFGHNGTKFLLKDPRAFGTYLRENFIMLRRTAKEVHREIPEPQRVPVTVHMDSSPLKDAEARVRELAEIILSEQSKPRDRWAASREIDMRLRQATGVAKAPAVADYIRLLMESGESVVAYAWHRAVYDILVDLLKEFRPAMYTGSETPAKKQRAKEAFINGESRILLISLRAGAGLDGLQHVTRTVVFAELDWSPGIHDQCIGRVARDGQRSAVTAYFCVAEEGSDPVVAETVGIKKEQVAGIVNPEGELFEETQRESGRIKELARRFLGNKKSRKKERARRPMASSV